MLPREAVLADLEQVLTALSRAAVYTADARSAAVLEVQRLQAQAGSLSRAHLLAGLARIAAVARDGHTNLDFGHLGQALPQLPVRLRWFADGLYVTAVRPGHAEWLGCQVVRLEDRDAEGWLPLLSNVIGGTADRVRSLSLPLLITPAFLHALGWAAADRHLRLLLRTPDGQRVPVRLAVGTEPPTVTLCPRSGLLNAPAAGASVHLQALPDRTFYVGLRQIDSGTDGPLPQVLGRALDEIRSARPRRVIVDLRGNGGGNYILTWPFTQRLRGATGQARLYALTDEDTFSAAIVTLAWLRHEAGARILGSGPGDTEQFYAEPSVLQLTAAKMQFFLATQSHDWATASHAFDTCFWMNLLYGVPAGSLRPDGHAKSTFAGYMQGQDAALQAALADDAPLPLPAERPRPLPPVNGRHSSRWPAVG